MHNVFISYHHRNDQDYKNDLILLNNRYEIFLDKSVETGDISDSLSTEAIRRKIRDERLRNSTVTILLLGSETQFRKHVDWELKSSMIDGNVNKRSGILVITLPYINCTSWHASHPQEKEVVYPGVDNWISLKHKSEYANRYPHMPQRIIDNLYKSDVLISVVPWDTVAETPAKLEFLIAATANSRLTNQYDLSEPMKMRDHNPNL